MKTLAIPMSELRDMTPAQVVEKLRAEGFELSEGDARPFKMMVPYTVPLKGNVSVSYADNNTTIVIRQE